MRIKLTPELAHAAGTDAGNRMMKKNNRTCWNQDDWNEAARVKNALLDKLDKGDLTNLNPNKPVDPNKVI